MSITLNEFVNVVGWEVSTSDFDKTLTIATNGLNKLKPVTKKISTALAVPVTALAGYMLKLSSDAEETSTKFNTIFADVEAKANRTSKALAKDYGLAGSASKKLLGNTGDLLTGFGFTGDKALDLSNRTQQLAVDLASFTNFSGGAEGASNALTKALLGEREGVKSLGISIQEEDLKKEMARLTSEGQVFATEREAKAVATLNIAYRQSKNAVGDFARTSKGLANQMRIMHSNVKTAAELFGDVLRPIATVIVNIFNKLLEVVIAIPGPLKALIVAFVALLTASFPILVVLTAMLGLYLKLSTAMTIYSLVTGRATLATYFLGIQQKLLTVWTYASAIAMKVASFATAIFTGAMYLASTASTVLTGGLNLVIPALIAMGVVVWGVVKGITAWWKGANKLKGSFGGLMGAIKEFAKTLMKIFGPLAKILLSPFWLLFKVTKFIFKIMLSLIGGSLGIFVKLFTFFVKVLNGLLQPIVKLFKAIGVWMDNLAESAREAMFKFLIPFAEVYVAIEKWAQGIGGMINGVVGGFHKFTGGLFQNEQSYQGVAGSRAPSQANNGSFAVSQKIQQNIEIKNGMSADEATNVIFEANQRSNQSMYRDAVRNSSGVE